MGELNVLRTILAVLSTETLTTYEYRIEGRPSEVRGSWLLSAFLRNTLLHRI